MVATLRLLVAFAAVALFTAGVRADDTPKPTGSIGVQLAASPTGKGLAIQKVLPGSPAEKAGVKNGDSVMKLDGKEVTDLQTFIQEVGAHKPGDMITLTVNRDGKDEDIKVTVGKPAPDQR
jgi:S1-C subfamily serine protease